MSSRSSNTTNTNKKKYEIHAKGKYVGNVQASQRRLAAIKGLKLMNLTEIGDKADITVINPNRNDEKSVFRCTVEKNDATIKTSGGKTISFNKKYNATKIN
jgi:hypothetical protein